MHDCYHNTVTLPEHMWENVDELNTFISLKKLIAYAKVKYQLCIVSPFIFFSNYWTNFKLGCMSESETH